MWEIKKDGPPCHEEKQLSDFNLTSSRLQTYMLAAQHKTYYFATTLKKLKKLKYFTLKKFEN